MESLDRPRPEGRLHIDEEDVNFSDVDIMRRFHYKYGVVSNIIFANKFALLAVFLFQEMGFSPFSFRLIHFTKAKNCIDRKSCDNKLKKKKKKEMVRKMIRPYDENKIVEISVGHTE